MTGADLPRAAGLVLGVALDAALGDPRRGHPVAAFGRLAGALEQRCWADRRTRGAAFAAAAVLPVVAAGVVGERATRTRPLTRTLVTAVTTWTVLGGRSLAAEGRHLHGLLLPPSRPDGPADLAPARERLSHLCGRDPSVLDADGLARAGVESVAENTLDAVVAPLLWGAVAGVPGLLGHRAVNTLDAMVGHRSPRYARFGTASARLDDVAAYVPARVTAGLEALLAPVVGGSPGAAVTAWRRDAAAHPSPNAGPVEAAAAGALGRTLGGTTVYRYRTEERPRLGDGPPPQVPDLLRAVRLCQAVTLAATALAAAVALRPGRPPRRRCRGSAPSRRRTPRRT